MLIYKLQNNFEGVLSSVTIVNQNISIPLDEANTDYQIYLKWLDGYESINGEWVQTNPDGNTPLPADE
jgi:hypothetical protein